MQKAKQEDAEWYYYSLPLKGMWVVAYGEIERDRHRISLGALYALNYSLRLV